MNHFIQKQTTNMFVGSQMISIILTLRIKGTKAVTGMMPIPKGTNI